MAISDNILDRDKKAYKENTTDGGLDRRVTDVDTQAKLDEVVTAIENISITVDDITVSNEVEIKNDVGNPVPISATNLDIRDLVFSTDKIDVTGSEVSLDATTLAALEEIDVAVTDISGSGIATEAKQDVGNASLSSIDSKLTSPLSVTGPLTDAQLRASAVPISATSLPLPTGAATEVTLASVLTELQQKTEPTDSQLVQATDLDIRNLTFAQDKVDASGSIVGLDATTLAALEDINVTVTSIGEVEIKNDAGSPVPISAASLPLPTGAATSALQTTGNSSLASIDTKLTSPLTVTGPLTDVQLRATPVPISGTVTANLGTIAGVATESTLSSIDTKLNSLGQKTMAASVPVVIASDQSTLPISATIVGTSNVTVTNGAGASAVNIQDGGNSITIDGTVSATQSGTWNINNVSGTVSLPTGASTLSEQQTQTASLSILDDWDESDRAKVNPIVGQAGVQGGSGTVSANTQRVVLATDVALPTGTNSIGQVTANAGTNLNTSALALETTQLTTNTRIGDLTETAPGTDTASSGLNGRLQRIAQRITSLLTATTDRTQKTQITNGSIDVAATSVAPVLSDNGLVVRPLPYEPQKYVAATNGFTLVATPTDIARIIGSNSKTIRVKRVVVSGRTTSGSPVAVVVKLIKYSTANTGGTSVATTAVPLNSTYAAATAAVNHYTANPTVGTIVGNVGTRSITFISATGFASINFDFDNPIVLNGVTEQLSVNFNSSTVTGSSICVNFEWEEV
jgi:hypothetical protein